MSDKKIDKDLLFKQYQICVDMADRISQRRMSTNKFYSALVSAILTVILSVFKDSLLSKDNQLAVFLFGLLGVSICIIWFLNIKSYKTLNSAKFKVILEQEKQLACPAYAKEWEILDNGKKPQKYITFSKIESYVPFILSLPFWAMLFIPLYNVGINILSMFIKP